MTVQHPDLTPCMPVSRQCLLDRYLTSISVFNGTYMFSDKKITRTVLQWLGRH